MEKYNIRSATQKDMDDINELCRQTFLLHLGWYPEYFNPKYKDSFRDYNLTFLNDPNKKIFIYEEGKKIQGLIKLTIIHTEEKPYKLEQNYLEVEEIVVDKLCRRKGIGSKLLQRAKEYASENGIKRIMLNVWYKNTDAIALYEKSGFIDYSKKMILDIE